MKRKFFAIILVFVSSFALWAWEMPDRYFELGLDVDLGMANSAFSWGEIFNSARTIEIDLNKLGEQEFGLDLLARANFFLDVRTKGKYKIGAGVFSAVESNGFGSLSQDAVGLLVSGNSGVSSLEGSAAVGGSVFASVGLRGTATIDKWKFTVSPSVFIPLLYMNKPDISYTLTNGDPFSGSITARADIYTALAPDNDSGINIEEILMPKGVDISADLSYRLFPFLEVGGTITHIPIVPASMSSGRRIDKVYRINGSGKSLQDLIEDDELDSLLDPEPGEDDLVSFSDGSQTVFRPLRFDAYAVYTPFTMNWMRLNLKPSVGLSFLTVYDTVHFNVGLETEFKLVNMLGLTWDFRYREQVWLNKLSLMLNFRALELDVGAGFRSMDLPGAFTAKGLYLACGFRLGF
jgi:hypothetical protein